MFARKKILVVDNEPEIIMGVSLRLKQKGYDIVTAVNGTQAKEVAAAELPDLAVMDIAMPEEDGHEVANWMQDNPRTKHIPIIFLTAYSTPDHVQKAQQAGVAEYITKPYEPAILMAAIDNLLVESTRK